MSGIPIYTSSPISPAKTSAITPQTAAHPESISESAAPTAPISTPATTTAAPSSTYPPARPGAALPTPTQAYTPNSTSYSPPAPQPGPVPSPIYQRAPSPRGPIPPPPKAGEKLQPASFYAPGATLNHFNNVQAHPFGQLPSQNQGPQLYPPQMGMPSPAENYRPGQSTTTYNPTNLSLSGGRPGERQGGLLSPPQSGVFAGMQNQGGQAGQNSNPTTPRRSFEHPPGYQQNPHAAEMTPEQRLASGGGGQYFSGQGYNPPYGNVNTPSTAGFSSPGGGIFGGGGSSPSGHGGLLSGGEDESVWGMATGWLKGVGKKAAELEESVWKRVNGEK
ncbi:MAG: mucin 7, secreted [Icmadophila ericetorum]|nr:mucin 7, secreted [Icmadophila ericetorum]